MNQALYLSHEAAIKAGEAARDALINRFDDIISSAATYRDSRLAEWQQAFPQWYPYRQGVPSQCLFDIHGHYDSHVAGDGTYQVAYRYYCGDGSEALYTAFIHESLMYATDEELTAYLKTAFESILKDRAEQMVKSKTKEDAKDRADYERLRAKLGQSI